MSSWNSDSRRILLIGGGRISPTVRAGVYKAGAGNCLRGYLGLKTDGFAVPCVYISHD